MDQLIPVMLVLGSMVSAMLAVVDASANPKIFNVVDYGANGDGVTDDTEAFVKAWNDTCNWKPSDGDDALMVVPKGKTFLVYPTTFAGPCNSNYFTFSLEGTIIAPDGGPSGWKQYAQNNWLVFAGITGLSVSGGGVIDGRGKPWWDVSCRYHPGQECVALQPTALSFDNCHQLYVGNIYVINSPQTHIGVVTSDNVDFKSLYINSPETSPNTDGIHFQNSSFVTVRSSIIKSGDDCIAIGDHTSNVNITYIDCGPGHGVSIGSLGRTEDVEADVHNILVSHVNFFRTTNGARIKTWQSGKGQVQQVRFQFLNFTEVENPIIIDQYYCDEADACKSTDTGVHISDVWYFTAIGTSKSEVAVNFNCSQAVPCTNINLGNIQLAPLESGQNLTSSCNNAHGSSTGNEQPQSCLSP